MTADKLDWPEWLKANPPPDLHALIAEYGTYSAIPPEAWEEYDRAAEDWNHRRRERLGGPNAVTRAAIAEARSRPSRRRRRK